MVHEGNAIRLIEDELASSELIVLQSRYLIDLMQAHAAFIVTLTEGNLKRFETQLSVINRLYEESTPEIKSLMTTAYSKIGIALSSNPLLRKLAQRNMGESLMAAVCETGNKNNMKSNI
ncbi:MAG TPA: hypothetical protein VG737_15770 [Cyclobacteriaceae bacterium]|nr:hypothetical protein [Cyclobacteriaceae bacterium]